MPLLVLFSAGTVHAQAIHLTEAAERYRPLPPEPVIQSLDPQPIGPSLKKLVILDGDNGAFIGLLEAGNFVGQPISLKLIHDIEMAVNRHLGEEHSPLVARWLPDTGVSSGILTLGVSTMVLGDLRLTGATPPEDAYIRRQLAQELKQAADSAHLAYSLDSLNQYPFWHIDANLTVTRSRPWEAYIGYKYYSEHPRAWKRYVAGATIGNWLGRDSVLALQLTATPDMVWHGESHPLYKALVITHVLPVARHTRFETLLDVEQVNFLIGPSVLRLKDVIATVGWRHDLFSHGKRGIKSDIRYGLEAKNEQAIWLTVGIAGPPLSSEVFQSYLGYHRVYEADGAHSDLDILAHVSPGELDPGNRSAQFARYSDNRQTSARYAYVNATYDVGRDLSSRVNWQAQFIVQLATAPLPYSEQTGIGSVSLVRGYHLIDGSFDNLLVMRNTLGLRLKPTSPTRSYLFVDVGKGHDIGLKLKNTVASYGIGTSYALTQKTTLSLILAKTLRDGQTTRRGSNEFDMTVICKF